MKTRFRSLTLTATSLALLAFAAGCETSECTTAEGEDAVCAESLTRYTVSGAEGVLEVPYVEGTDLVVDNVKGNIYVEEGPAGVVAVDYEPFTYRGHSKDAEAKDEIENLFIITVEDDGAGTITAFTDQGDGASNELGATLHVTLPPEFNGVLRVVNQGVGEVEPGNIDVNYTAGAATVNVENESLVGDCEVTGSGAVTSTNVTCGDFVVVRGVSDQVNVTATGLQTDESIIVELASISADAGDSVIESEDGQVDVIFPVGANFQVDAATSEGLVTLYDVQEACTPSGDDASKSVTCGDGGPIFTINAGLDGVGDSNVNLDFDPTNNG